MTDDTSLTECHSNILFLLFVQLIQMSFSFFCSIICLMQIAVAIFGLK